MHNPCLETTELIRIIRGLSSLFGPGYQKNSNRMIIQGLDSEPNDSTNKHCVSEYNLIILTNLIKVLYLDAKREKGCKINLRLVQKDSK